MKKKIITLMLLLIGGTISAQRNKMYTSLEEIEAAHPDSVFLVSLINNYQGESIPDYLFKCKNITSLSICGEYERKSGKPRSVIPFKNLTGISNFKSLKYLNISNTSVNAIPSEYLELLNFIQSNSKNVSPTCYLNIVGTNISTVAKLQGKEVTLDLEIIQIKAEEEQKWLKNKSRDGGEDTDSGRVPKKIKHYNMYAG